MFLLALVIAESALALTPGPEAVMATWIMAGAALAGVANTLTVAAALRRIERPHWSDLPCYGVAPVVACGLLTATTASAAAGVGHASFAVALAVLLTLMLAIRNAWDLVTFLAARPS